MGISGVAVDIGRMYMARNEAQSYADSAALNAAMKLDGTATGIQAAKDIVAASNNKWGFNTRNFTGTVVQFSQDGSAGWDANPGDATNIKYVRVIASAQNLELYLLPVAGTPTSVNVSAAAVAGQILRTSFGTNSNTGILPFSPYAHAEGVNSSQVLANDPTGNFGFTVGQLYTIRWPSNPKTSGKNTNVCAGDLGPSANLDQWADKADAKSNSERGYIQDTSASAIRAAIEDDHMDFAVTLDQQVNMTGGAKGTEGDCPGEPDRAGYGSHVEPILRHTSRSRDGNGRRVVTVADQFRTEQTTTASAEPRLNRTLWSASRNFSSGTRPTLMPATNRGALSISVPAALIISQSNTGAGGGGSGAYLS